MAKSICTHSKTCQSIAGKRVYQNVRFDIPSFLLHHTLFISHTKATKSVNKRVPKESINHEIKTNGLSQNHLENVKKE